MPTTVIATYRIRPGQEAAFEALLAKHWPTLSGLGLVTETPARVFKRKDVYYELFTWKDEASVGVAHETPEVMAIWEPMSGLCESLEFPHVEELTFS